MKTKNKTFANLLISGLLVVLVLSSIGSTISTSKASSGIISPIPSNNPQSEPPLRITEPVEDVIKDLEAYIPEYIRQQDVPGVSIALIRDDEVAWTEGFGVANTITRKPVTAETLFAVASNSKVVTAYIALRLVDQGLLSLDEPLNTYLQEPWLPPSEYRDVITLRHVVSHNSGLGHSTTNRDNLFPPGAGYSYSAIGFLYLQEVLEQITGKPLKVLAEEMVFEPLGMSSSSFVNHAGIVPQTANGHVHALIPIVIFTLPFGICTLILGLLGLIILRIRAGKWQPTRRMVLGTLGVAFMLTCLLIGYLVAEIGIWDYFWMVLISGFVLMVLITLLVLVGGRLSAALFPGRPRQQRIITLLWSLVTVVVLVIGVSSIRNLPVPKSSSIDVNAAGTMRSTASDLGTFLLELANPQYLSEEVAAQMKTPQVRLRGDLSWGLGPGIQHSQWGNALWQWGQAPDFLSVMIVYPEHDAGVVVFTNSDLLNPDVAIHIAQRALGGKIESLRRASHLEFNYRTP